MGILDAIEGLAAQDGGTNAKVAGGLMQALEEHPGGLAGVISQFQQNGMGEHVQNWASGQQQTATPDQVQQGLGGTGFIDNVAAKAGVSPAVAKMAWRWCCRWSWLTLHRVDSRRPRKVALQGWPRSFLASSPRSHRHVGLPGKEALSPGKAYPCGTVTEVSRGPAQVWPKASRISSNWVRRK